MKKAIMLVALVSVVGAANAQTFFAPTTTFTVPSASAIMSGNGTNSAKLTVSNFLIAGGAVEDLAWSFKFDSAPVASYTGVNFIIKGHFLTGGPPNSLSFFATEKVFDVSGAAVLRADDLLDSTVNAATPGAFTVSKFISFSQPVTLGLVQKDILMINNGVSDVVIDEVIQEFQPVPEPATMFVLGSGVLAMARRRKNRS